MKKLFDLLKIIILVLAVDMVTVFGCYTAEILWEKFFNVIDNFSKNKSEEIE